MHSSCDLHIRQIWIWLITEFEKYCKRRCSKYLLITDLDQLKQRLRTECPSWIMSSLRQPFVIGIVDRSRSVMRVLYTFSCNIPNTLWSIGFKSAEFGGHSWDGINFGVTLSNNSVVTRARRAFQVSQGSVETLFGWGGNVYIILQQIYSGNYVPKFTRIARVL